jgi:NADH:ubiquinone oxidoreductase subunit 6 (subunit J)
MAGSSPVTGLNGKNGLRLKGRTGVLAAFALLLAMVNVPVFSTVVPPLVDYPNHLARLNLIAEGGNQFYAVRWALLPDLAADLVVPLLARAMPLALAGKLFLVLTFALLAGGTLWLNRVATGRWRLWPLLAFLLLYNRILLWGYLNYLFGLGLALCGVALWLALERRSWLRSLAAIPIALACFFSHIAAFGVYALAILGVELVPVLSLLRHDSYRDAGRRIAIAAAQFVIPAVILCFFTPASPAGSISYGEFWRKADLLFDVFDNYNRPFDIACFVLLIALIGGLAWRRRLTITPRLGIAVAIVSAAYLLLPSQLMSGSGVDRRLPIALFLLLIAATAPAPLPRRPTLALGVIIVVVFAVRMAVIEAVWLKANNVYGADLEVIDRLPEGAKLAVAYPAREVNAGGIPELHMPVLAAMRREAFVPTIFAYATQQPLVLRPPFAALAAKTSAAALWAGLVDGAPAARAEIAPVLQDYDYVVFVDRDRFAVKPLPCLKAMPSTPTFQLYALTHENCL